MEELEHALEEGVVLENLAAPIAFNGDEHGRLISLTVQRMELDEPDDSGTSLQAVSPPSTVEHPAMARAPATAPAAPVSPQPEPGAGT